MNESAKTITFVVVAAAVLLLAWIVQPKPPTAAPDDLVGQELFPSFTDPMQARRMKVVAFDEATGTLNPPFEVAQVDRVWSLPSHDNYPADAQDQLAAAATSLIGVKVLGVASGNTSDHELYGVVEPDEKKLKPGASGVGKLVEFQDAAGKSLARLVIGKPDRSKDGEPARIRFVRRLGVSGQDQVLRVALETDRFSTNFQDWIETGLLQLAAWDICRVQLNDYRVTPAVTPTGRVMPAEINWRDTIKLSYDDNDREEPWKLNELIVFKDNAATTEQLPDDERLNVQKLNELKNSLGDLKIVDVLRKPEGMAANLRADASFLDDQTARRNLEARGFFPVEFAPGQFSILSSEGEVIVGMLDGVEYVLRFGAFAGIERDQTTADSEDRSEHIDADGNASDAGKLNRFLLVMAQFNEDLIPKPELTALPETNEPAASAPNDNADSEQPKADASNTADSALDESLEAQREREAKRLSDERDNLRKQDEYNDKAQRGRQRAKELNARFADWYYIVPDSVYRKIRLARSDVIQKKTGTEEDEPDFQSPGLPGAGDPFLQQQLDALRGVAPAGDLP